MTKLPLKFVHAFKDRHGKARYYFRRPGFKGCALPGLPGSAEFMNAYQDALKGTPQEIGASQTIPRSINALVAAYYASADFKALRPSTARVYRNILERFRRPTEIVTRGE